MNHGLPRQIVDLLHEAKRNFEKLLRHTFEHYQLTMPQIALIILLQENKEMSVSDISTKMGLSKSTVSGIIDRLEQLEIVERRRSETDRRRVTALLTDAYKKRALELEQNFNTFLYEIFSEVSETDLMDIIKGLTMFNQIISNNIDAALINR